MAKSRVSGSDTVLPGGFGGALPVRIHELLEQEIIQGVFEPGARMHADKLAARYGVSRIPVREALRSLHEAGWVEIRPRHGVYVRERSERELRDLVEARAVVEAVLARWAAERRSTADVERLHRIVRASFRAVEHRDDTELARLSADFHAAVRSAARNEIMGTISADLEKRSRFYFPMTGADVGAGWAGEHERLAALIAEGDADRAEAESLRHVRTTGEALASLRDPRRPPADQPVSTRVTA